MKKRFFYGLGILSSLLVILVAIGCVKKEAVSESPRTLGQQQAPRVSMPPAERGVQAPRAGIEGAGPGLREEKLGRASAPSEGEARTPSGVRQEKLEEARGAAGSPGAGAAEPGRRETVARVPEEKAAVPREAAVLLLKDIYFEFDKYDLKEESKKTLQEIAEWLLKNPRVKLQIEGHSDERGTDEYNLALGERRATAAFRYLKSLGVSEERLSTVSYGEMRPADPGHNEEAWVKNRRGHFVPLTR